MHFCVQTCRSLTVSAGHKLNALWRNLMPLLHTVYESTSLVWSLQNIIKADIPLHKWSINKCLAPANVGRIHWEDPMLFAATPRSRHQNQCLAVGSWILSSIRNYLQCCLFIPELNSPNLNCQKQSKAKHIKDKLCSNHERVAHDVFLGSIDKTTWAKHPKLFLYSVLAPVNVGITINLDQPCTCPKASWPLHKLSINILWETKITLPEIISKIQNSSNHIKSIEISRNGTRVSTMF